MQGDQLGGRRNRLMSKDENLKLGRHGGDAYKAKCEYWGQNNRVGLHVVGRNTAGFLDIWLGQLNG